MKRQMVIAAAVALGIGLAAPQYGFSGEGKKDAGHHAKWSEKRFEKMSGRLKLSDKQKASVKSAMDEKHQKMKALHEEFQVKRRALSDEYDAKIAATLTEQQRAEFAKMKAEKDERREKMMKTRGKGPKGERAAPAEERD